MSTHLAAAENRAEVTKHTNEHSLGDLSNPMHCKELMEEDELDQIKFENWRSHPMTIGMLKWVAMLLQQLSGQDQAYHALALEAHDKIFFYHCSC